MRASKILGVGLGLMLMGTGAAMADGPKIYRYGGAGANYCPNGLEPISIAGVICCGKPNQSMTYQQAMAHPVRKRVKRRYVRQARVVCPVGEKGCYSN